MSIRLVRARGGVYFFRKFYPGGAVCDVAVSRTEAELAKVADRSLIPDADLEARALVCAKQKIAAMEEEKEGAAE